MENLGLLFRASCQALFIAFLTAWMLTHSRLNLLTRTVGEAPHSAYAIGFHVLGLRYAAVLFAI